MTAEIDENGNIYTYQGDTIILECENIPQDSNYLVYFSIRSIENGSDVIPQMPFIPTGGVAEIYVPPSVTDTIPVPADRKFKDYRYALKACNTSTNAEHTLIVGDSAIGTEYKLRVYRKQSEGSI